MATVSWRPLYCGLFFFLLVLALASCGPATVSPTAVPAPSPTPVPPTAMPSPSPTARPIATPTPSPEATVTAAPTASPVVTPPPPPTYGPAPTLVPTVDPTALPGLVLAALTVREEEGVAGHPRRRVTGWEYGVGGWGDCTYRWLDEEHLLLPAFAGEEENMGTDRWTLPVVVNLFSGAVWLPQTQRSLYCCNYPRWSEVLQVLIVVRQRDVLFLDPEGEVVQQYSGASAFDISPSGRRLLIGSVWYDLETGRTVDTSETGRPAWFAAVAAGAGERAAGGGPTGSWAWSSDETRLFGCCFYYLDVNHLEQSGPVDPGYLRPVGRGFPGCGSGISSMWVLHDKFAVPIWDFFTTQDGDMEQRVGDPFIDPIAQTYTDLCTLVGAPPGECHMGGFPSTIAPDGNHILLLGKGKLYMVGSDTVTAYPWPDDQHGMAWTWSPDSRSVLLGHGLDQAGRREYWLISTTEFRSAQVAGASIPAPAWSPHGEWLAFFQDDQTLVVMDPQTLISSSLALPQPSTRILWQPQSEALAAYSETARALTVVDTESWTAATISLSRPLAQVLWQPQGTGLVVLADDGSLWWLSDLSGNQIDPLTPPLPAVRDLQWSPDGRSLVLVSGADVYVVSVNE